MILGRTKAEVDKTLGKGVMARNLLGQTAEGEKAVGYDMGDFELIVGFYSQVARYVAFRRRRGPNNPLSPSEVASALALHGPSPLWKIEERQTPRATKSKKPSTRIGARGPTLYFSLAERDTKSKDRILREIIGFAPGGAPYAFFYLPVLEGAPPLLPSEWSVAEALG